jgi:hypothetical protein
MAAKKGAKKAKKGAKKTAKRRRGSGRGGSGTGRGGHAAVNVVQKYTGRAKKRIKSLEGHVDRSEDLLTKAIAGKQDLKKTAGDLLDVGISLWDDAIGWMTMSFRDHD